MRRFLVVGCGGSGGATLAYMMDQLRSDLAAYGFGLPAGWQFLHLDVPTGQDKGPDGLGNVVQQGGAYVGCGPQGSDYAPLDAAVSMHPRILDELATWAPRAPHEVPVPINVGAGQFRAIGRMITLSRPSELNQRLSQAWSNLRRVETEQELTAIGRVVPGLGHYDPGYPPVVLVVSSMAGGSGASMALDVCRLLTRVQQIALTGVFMYTADVFDGLPDAARTGVRGNSLAMVGEIIAAQSGAARTHDQSVLSALGLDAGESATTPFARVFPVSRLVGMRQAPLGDKNQFVVFRSLARGLAGLMMSELASSEFVSYDLGNTGQLTATKDVFGWGLDGPLWDPMPWAGFGYACLSTGRDRFGEYAAQRIASGAVDRLVEGHLTPGSSVSGVEQVKALLDSQWVPACHRIGLPVTAQDFFTWLTSTVFRGSMAAAQSITSTEVAPFLSPPAGQNGPQFLQTIRGQLAAQKARMTSAAEQSAYRQAFSWHQVLAEATLGAVGEGVSRHGLAYGIALLDRVETHLRELLVSGAQEGARRGPADVSAVPTDTESTVGAIRGTIANSHQVMAALLDNMRHPVRALILAYGCRLIDQFVPAFVAEYLSPLRTALADALAFLNMMRDSDRTPLVDVGLARLQTDQYLAWPSDSNQQVPARFTHAVNEVLLIKATDFDAEFRKELITSVSSNPAQASGFAPASGYTDRAQYDAARQSVLGQVIAGEWQTTGGAQPPRNLIELTASWRTRVFGQDPDTMQMSVPQVAKFDLHVRPAEVLHRARQFVERPDWSFDRFVKTSLRDLLSIGSGTDAENVARQNEVTSAFSEALDRAQPMISVDQGAVEIIHAPASVRYRYKFSEVPFRGLPLASLLADILATRQDIDPVTVSIFRESLKDNSVVSRIDIFGSYANLSPVVFNSILTPASDEWAATPLAGKRDYWRWRRSRPLPAALAMGDDERRAMVAGWFVGQIVGELRMPSPPFSDSTGPVEIWDAENNRWLAFPHPMLTPPAQFIAEYDWLPAVLESSLLAFATASRPQRFASMRPYQLLRGLFDDSKIAPTAQSTLTQFAGERRIGQWLATGNSVAREPSKVPGASEASTAQARADLAMQWLEAINGLAGREYCAPGQAGASGGGTFASITSRRQASATPIFRDVAPDVYLMTSNLRNIVRQALARAANPMKTASGQVAGADDPGLLPPTAGVSF